MSQRKSRIVRYKCPHCSFVSVATSHTKFIQCGHKRCNITFCWMRHQVSKDAYNAMYGVTADAETAASAYIKAWLKKDKKRYHGTKLERVLEVPAV